MNFEERFNTIKRILSVLIEVRSVAELRVPTLRSGSKCGLFSDLNALAAAAAKSSGKAPGVFIGLNPVKRSSDEVTNRLAKVSSAIRDIDIQRRRWLPIDFDPVRSSNTPSTDAEHAAAIHLANECRDWLRKEGWPDPILADSGNGAHLLYRIALPNDEPSRDLVKGVLEAISLRFSYRAVVVDVGNFNASRVWRLYGTLNRKGEATIERPHRRAKTLDVPDEIEIVGRKQLYEIASRLPVASESGPKEKVDLARWIAEHNVPVVADSPWKNGGHKWSLQCPWNESHTNNSAFLLRFPDGGIAAGCLHKSCAGNNWLMLRALYEPRHESAIKPECAGGSEKTLPVAQGSTQTRQLLDFASDLSLFCTPQGESYAKLQVGNHSENHRIDSRAFKQWLHLKYFRQTGTSPRPHSVQEVVSHFDAVARYDSPREPVFIRVAADRKRFFLDLGDEQWRAVEFSVDGWRVVKNPAPKFRRLPGMLPLPSPVLGGDINELKTFLNLRGRADWTLFVSTLLAALLPRGPYPVLCIHGEAGSAKSTTSRVFRTLIDPNVSPSRATPKDVRDLMIMANNGWVLSFDNLSYLPVWFSDCLCRLSTGGGFSTREIYTNADEVIFEGQRPIILNGIEEVASRTDLLDRSVLLDLPVIGSWREERIFWKQFETAQPRLLGALLEVAVEALRNMQSVRLTEKPRMADFAVLATAAEPALGLPTGGFMKYYSRNRDSANAVALEASPVATLIIELVKKSCWQGTAEELLRKLSDMAPEDVRKRRLWPKTPKVVSGMLRRLATALRKAGIDIELWRENDRLRTRMISIKQRGANARPHASART
jgi:hypothetical protein